MNGFRIYSGILHAAAWFAFFILVVILAPGREMHSFSPNPPFPDFLVRIFPVLVLFFYLNSFLLIPRILARQQLWAYLGCLLFFSLLIPGITAFRDLFSSTPGNLPPEIRAIQTLYTLVLFLLVLIASTGNNIVQNWFSAESQRREIEFQKTATELSFLKSQINPHFLFNTLNNIYTLSILKSEKAADSILKLADMMRYVLTEVGDKPVPMEQEIHYLEQFIDLQKIRLTESVKVEFQVFGDPAGHTIAPLLLLPFIENAFKYGVSTRIDSIIKISITLKPGTIILQTENQVFEEKLAKELSTGTGLRNAGRRLELLYPDRHWLRTETIGSKFFADLTLNV
jgi:two-component system LytT family sensor kinase